MGGKGKVFDHRHYWSPSCVLVSFRISAAAIGWFRAPPPVSLQLARATDVLRVSNGLLRDFTKSAVIARNGEDPTIYLSTTCFCAFQSEEFRRVTIAAAIILPDLRQVVVRRILRISPSAVRASWIRGYAWTSNGDAALPNDGRAGHYR